MSPPSYGAYAHLDTLTAPLVAAAEMTAEAVRKRRKSRQPLRGAMLRAGRDTPHWNRLAEAVVKRLRRRGDKTKLAKALGISRQRLHLLLVAKTAYPDAERALQLVEWLQAARPSPSVK